ncbi:hypothetical protein F5876DRAFT_71454 [Lentinula aff. lateritia]|uniref:Uncharacterized protein n=1 Tax=Lentinula aff. lateritia TaxID=2804960 RepID=A0ACC1UGJ4_9AGAR|nr:hypothetical protein F5876DRAFT_71454 [Lentinula aff. lateritia]
MNSVTVFSVGSSEAFSLLSSVWTSSSSVDSDDEAETSPGPTDQENESSASAGHYTLSLFVISTMLMSSSTSPQTTDALAMPHDPNEQTRKSRVLGDYVAKLQRDIISDPPRTATLDESNIMH